MVSGIMHLASISDYLGFGVCSLFHQFLFAFRFHFHIVTQSRIYRNSKSNNIKKGMGPK